MAAPYNPPKKNEEFKIRVALPDLAVAGALKSSPHIDAGDWKVDKDGAGFTNFATLPTNVPASTPAILLELSATEMNADVVTIWFKDQTVPAELAEFFLSIPTTS